MGLLGLTAVATPTLDLEKEVGSLIAAERAYAKQGAEKGFRAASLSNLADDAVIFAPELINGKKFWQESKEDPVIRWRPAFASIARSGELGYTTGPAEYRDSPADEKPNGFGHFVSVWQKDATGTWKVVVDVGVNHTRPQDEEKEVRTWVPKSPLLHPESASANFETANRTFAESLKKGEGAAILASASEDIRVYRRGAIPLFGRAAAQGMLGSEPGKTSRTRRGGGMSKAGDLAFEYGEYSSERDSGAERGIYLCIWRLASDNNWKLVVDLQKKAPPEKK